MTALLAHWALLLLVAGAAQPFDPFHEAGIDHKADAAAPLTAMLRDQAGATHTLAELGDGKPIVLVPVQHRCPNICGMTLSGLAQAIRAQSFVPGRDFTVVAFGIDANETAADAAVSLKALQVDAPMAGAHAVVTDAATIDAVTRGLGYRFAWDARIGQFAHVAATAVLVPDGRLARWLYGVAPDATDLKLALIDAGEGKVGDWGDQLLLLCYHYDPATGRYGSIVEPALQIAGAGTVLALAGFIGLSLWRERRKAG